jgi:xylose dehydrogenase (NAD/NADP)
MELAAYFDDFTEQDWKTGSDGTVRLAMIGIGWWTREFAAPVTEELDNCETTVAVSSSTEKAEEFASEVESIEQGITYNEFHEGGASDAYDAMYVATPNSLHLPYVETAAELGKDVLCEKPMEASVERSEEMVDVAADISIMIAYRMHVDPAVRRMRELVRDGFIGDPVYVHGNMSQRLMEMFDDPDQWRLDPDYAGAGTSVTDLGIYPLNTTRFILESDPVAVNAAMWSGNRGFDRVPDERAAFTVEYEGNVFGSFTASQNGYANGFLKIIGTDGELELEPAFLDDSKLTLDRSDITTSMELPDLGVYRQMRKEFEYFSDCVLSDREPNADAEHGVVDMRAIEAAFEAAKKGERIEL